MRDFVVRIRKVNHVVSEGQNNVLGELLVDERSGDVRNDPAVPFLELFGFRSDLSH